MTRQWLPQNDILAHPNVVLFISQGGTFSNYEAIANGVPMLIIPFNHDHSRNGLRAQTAGYAEYIEFYQLTSEKLFNTIRHMLFIQDSYSIKAKELATIMNDNLVPPMDEAVYWIEYVCQFNGAKHLKTHARHQNWFIYLLVDVFLVTFVGFSIFFYIICCVCCRCPKRQQTRYNPYDPHKKNK